MWRERSPGQAAFLNCTFALSLAGVQNVPSDTNSCARSGGDLPSSR
jgi:hypothetical protein